MLEVTDLRFRYRGAEAESYRYDITVAAGEIAGLSGESGCGKSTLLDLIGGFLEPLSGSIRVAGREIGALAPAARPVTILFQRNNLFDHLTAFENVALGIRPGGRLSDADRSRVGSALGDVELSDFAQRRASLLSGGQAQRVALARSLARQRPVLLLDEPFTGLDPKTRESCLFLVRRIASAGALAVLMVTHDSRDCDLIADSRYSLEDGATRPAG